MPQHIAVIEWDSSMNPTVIVGPDAHLVNMAVIDRLRATCAPQDVGDAPTFLLDHPAPDAAAQDAPALAVAWLEALSEAATVPWVTNYVVPAKGTADTDGSNRGALEAEPVAG